jgi:hypothetical protein
MHHRRTLRNHRELHRNKLEFLERRALLSAVVETLGVEGHGTYTINRPDMIVADASAVDRGGPEADGFQIEVVFGGGLTAQQQAVFTQAANRWQQILTGDIPDVGSGNWGAPVDDVRISASGVPIDGVGGILGSAGPQFLRGGSFLPINGNMQFDTADLASLLSAGQLDEVITHEMGHVLGLGTIWSNKGLLANSGTSTVAFTGAQAKIESNAARRTAAGTSVPVENTGGSGTANSHWRESTFDNELMTGFLNNGANPLSRITAAQFVDLGYPQVNVDAADPYVPPGGNTVPTIGALTAAPSPVNQGGTLTLSASGASDSDGISEVRFYLEGNGLPGLQAGMGDVQIGADSSSPYALNYDTSTLAPGNYTFYARSVDAFGAVSAAASTTAVVQDPAAPAPSQPTLDAASDTGISNSDHITNDNTPTFTGTAQTGLTVKIFASGVQVGSQLVTDGTYSITTSVLSNGVKSITALSTDGSVVSPSTTAFNITIDTVAPAIVGTPTFNYLPATHSLRYTFNEDIGGSLGPSNMTVVRLPLPGTTIGTSMTFNASAKVASFTFPGEPNFRLGDGSYTATLAGVTDVAGNALVGGTNVLNFFFLLGDANHDATVNLTDFNTMAANFGQTGKDFSGGDFSYDGTVDLTDFNILAARFGTSVAPAASVLSSTFGSKRIGADNPADDLLA